MVTNNGGTAKNNNSGGGPNTGLIAGLTTGLVCAALIALTAGLLIYRKRKRAQMTDINRKLSSLESPTSLRTEMVMTAPTFSNKKVPPTPAPTSALPPTPQAPAPVATSMADHYQEESLYIGSPIFIPPLSATTSFISNKAAANGTNTATIQRSLTLSARPRYDPSKTLAVNNISATKNNNAASPLNRSSSVKVTKYDYNPPILDDDDLDHVQIRRAISVKRRNAAPHSTYLARQPSTTPHISISRSTSLRSQTTNSRLFDDGFHSVMTLPTTTTTTSANDDKMEGDGNNNGNDENDNDDDDDDDYLLDEATSTSAKSGAIQVVCAKPTIARIRSISRKDSTGKKTTKVVDNHDQQQPKNPQHATTDDSSSSSHLTPHQPKPLERMSMRSLPDSTHSSTLADGEITVYWQPPSN